MEAARRGRVLRLLLEDAAGRFAERGVAIPSAVRDEVVRSYLSGPGAASNIAAMWADEELRTSEGVPLALLHTPDLFDGSGYADEWLGSMEHYMQLTGVPASQWVGAASTRITGGAARFWGVRRRELQAQGQPLTWAAFCGALRERYGGPNMLEAERALQELTVLSAGSLGAYATEFEYLWDIASPGSSEKLKIQMFLDGLTPDVRRVVQMAQAQLAFRRNDHREVCDYALRTAPYMITSRRALEAAPAAAPAGGWGGKKRRKRARGC